MAGHGPIYAYDGTIDGFYTCVFTAFERKETPFDIIPSGQAQLSLLSVNEDIPTRSDLASRVDTGLRNRLGADEAEHVKLAFLSDSPHHEMAVLSYIQKAMREGRYAYCDHADPVVAAYERLWREVANERHAMIQFARFSEVEGGIYVARINPKAKVVPVVMSHFARRFNTQSFIIFDEAHGMAGVSREGCWSLVETSGIDIPPATAREEECRSMWRSFYDAVCNKERLNPSLRRSFMPKRLWRNITEMQGPAMTS